MGQEVIIPEYQIIKRVIAREWIIFLIVTILSSILIFGMPIYGTHFIKQEKIIETRPDLKDISDIELLTVTGITPDEQRALETLNSARGLYPEDSEMGAIDFITKLAKNNPQYESARNRLISIQSKIKPRKMKDEQYAKKMEAKAFWFFAISSFGYVLIGLYPIYLLLRFTFWTIRVLRTRL